MRYNNVKELVKNEVPLKFRASLVPIIEAGFEVYSELNTQRPDLFASNFITNVQGRLINYFIFRQFELDIVNDKYNYECRPLKVNNFNYNTLLLTNGNVNINLAKVICKGDLPNAAKYRLELARNNDFETTQLKMNVDGKGNNIIGDDVSYLILLTYGGKYSLDFAELIVPSNDLKDVCYTLDLISEYNIAHINREEQQVKIQKAKPRLKEEVIRKLEILKNVKGE